MAVEPTVRPTLNLHMVAVCNPTGNLRAKWKGQVG